MEIAIVSICSSTSVYLAVHKHSIKVHLHNSCEGSSITKCQQVEICTILKLIQYIKSNCDIYERINPNSLDSWKFLHMHSVYQGSLYPSSEREPGFEALAWTFYLLAPPWRRESCGWQKPIASIWPYYFNSRWDIRYHSVHGFLDRCSPQSASKVLKLSLFP